MKIDNNKKEYAVTPLNLALRVFAGVYLLYLVYQLVGGLEQNSGTMVIVSIAASILFVAAGIAMIVHGAYSLATGRYAGGAMDVSDLKDTQENEIREKK